MRQSNWLDLGTILQRNLIRFFPNKTKYAWHSETRLSCSRFHKWTLIYKTRKIESIIYIDLFARKRQTLRNANVYL